MKGEFGFNGTRGKGVVTSASAPCPVVLQDGRTLVIRGLLRADAEGVRGMLLRSSPHTLYSRFLTAAPAVSDVLLSLLADPDRKDGAILGAVAGEAVAGEEVVGHAMYARTGGEDGREAEVALVVEDPWQSNGLGKLLLAGIASVAAREGIEVFTWLALVDNRRVLRLARAVFSQVHCEIECGSCFMRAPLAGLRPGFSVEGRRTWECRN